MYSAVQSRVVTMAGWCTVWHKTNGVHTCTVGCVTQDQALADITQCRERGVQDRTCDHTSYPVTQAHTHTHTAQWQWYWRHLTPSEGHIKLPFVTFCPVSFSFLETLLWFSSSKGRTTECGLCNKEAYFSRNFLFYPYWPQQFSKIGQPAIIKFWIGNLQFQETYSVPPTHSICLNLLQITFTLSLLPSQILPTQ